MMTIGKRIKTIRGKQTQAEFAAENNIPLTTLGRYERGDNLPDLEFVSRICSKYGILYEWLVDGKEAALKDSPPERPTKPTSTAKLEEELEQERNERRELNQENRILWHENKALMKEISYLKEENARLSERLTLGEKRLAIKLCLLKRVKK